jgi:signal transduction histidine kinase
MLANESTDVELCTLLEEVVETMSSGAPVPSLDCQAEGILVHANRERLGAIVGHLIRNAQDATPGSGSIIVRLFRRSDSAIIEVQDSGTGMDKDFINNRLFRPFEDKDFINNRLFRPFDSTKGKSGMGIGVYETRDYVHRLGGAVEVISRVGEGTTFRIRIPISDTAGNDVEFAAKFRGIRSNGRNYKEITGY